MGLRYQWGEGLKIELHHSDFLLQLVQVVRHLLRVREVARHGRYAVFDLLDLFLQMDLLGVYLGIFGSELLESLPSLFFTLLKSNNPIFEFLICLIGLFEHLLLFFEVLDDLAIDAHDQSLELVAELLDIVVLLP